MPIAHLSKLASALLFASVLSAAGCSSDESGPSTVQVTAAVACKIVDECGTYNTSCRGATCAQVCPGDLGCSLPQSFVQSVESGNGDASAIPDGGAIVCPVQSGQITVQCIYPH